MFNDGWLVTQDIVDIKNHELYILGRESRFINSGGNKVNPIEIETVLLSIENIEEVIVIGVLDNNGIVSYGFVINGILLVCLVIYLMLSTSTIRDRQYSNWDKRYFDYVNDISDKV